MSTTTELIALSERTQENDSQLDRGSNGGGDSILNDASRQQEFSLPPADGGMKAWLFLAGCFAIEALVWGESSSSSFLPLPILANLWLLRKKISPCIKEMSISLILFHKISIWFFSSSSRDFYPWTLLHLSSIWKSLILITWGHYRLPFFIWYLPGVL